MGKNDKETVVEEKGAEKEWEHIAVKLADHILHYGLNELRLLLCDYALHGAKTSMLLKNMPDDEEVYLTFTDPEPEKKNLRLQFRTAEWTNDNSIALIFSFTGRYAQYETGEYVYLCKEGDGETVGKLLEDQGISILDIETDKYKWNNFRLGSGQKKNWDGKLELQWQHLLNEARKESEEEEEKADPYGREDQETEYYTYFELDKPIHHNNSLSFVARALTEPPQELGAENFELQLVIEGRPVVNVNEPQVQFETMYLAGLENERGCCSKKMPLRCVPLTRLESHFRKNSKNSVPFFRPSSYGIKVGERVFRKADGEVLRLGWAPEWEEMLLYNVKDSMLRNYSRKELREQLDRKLNEALFLEEGALTDLDVPGREAEEILEDYLYFHANKSYILQSSRSHAELERSRYNLMLVAEDGRRAVQFVEILRESMPQPKISDDHYQLFREPDLLDERLRITKEEFWEENNKMLKMLGHSDNLVVICDCQERPVFNPDKVGNGNAQEALKAKSEAYDRLWEQIGEAARKNSGILMIIAGRRTYARTLRFNPIIHDIVCEHHLAIRDLSLEEVGKLFIKKIEKSSFGQVDASLRDDVTKYVDVIYPTSKLRGMEFIDTYFDQFLSRYMLKEKKDDTLSGCIPPVRKSSAEEILAELHRKPGMDGVADSLEKLYHMKDVLLRMNDVYHMSFEGNPGTGKTMVARMMAQMLFYMGVIKKPLCIEVSAGDFKSKWTGGTNEKVKEMFRSAQGGVLFIDEAYLLAEGSKQEGIGLLIQEMEDKENPDRPLVIFAGYEDRMRDLLKTNAGLNSRIKGHIKFRDYTREELYEILLLMLHKVGFTIAEGDKPRELLNRLIIDRMSGTDFGNARAMEQLAEDLAAQHAEREAERGQEKSRTTTFLIEAEDVEALLPKTDTRQITKILKTQPKVEAEFEKLKAGIAYRKSLERAGLSVHIPAARRHMVFRGAPGTGKTTVAKLLADYLCEAEALPTSKLITVQIQDLLHHNGGNLSPAKNVEELVERARGGILLMDEAYTLGDVQESWREEIIQALLTKMEERREDTVFIFAGYPEEMDRFIDMNPGFESRIGYNFLFESYKEDVLATMFLDKMEQAGLRFDEMEKARKKLEEIMRYFSGMPGFGNGRFVDNLFEDTVNRHGKNLLKKHSEAASGAEGSGFADYSEEELITYSAESDLPTIKEILESRGVEDDPVKRMEYQKRQTAIHELGHAVVLAACRESMMAGARRAGEYPVNIKEITIRPQYPASGWVESKPNYAGQANRTERYYKEYLAWGMAGRAAEKLYFGSHTPGCSQDYRNVKSMAKQMIEWFAMGDLGITSPMDLVREADETASRLIVENREFIDITVDFLVQFEEIEGTKFEEAFHIYRTEGGEALRDYLKGLKG